MANVLEPANTRTLRGVCELIASHAERTRVVNAGHFGTSSKSAGAFLAIRSLLLCAGADAGAVRPSLPIADVTRRFPQVFLGPISRLAPGRLPAVLIRTPGLHAAAATTGLGIFGSLGLGAAEAFGLASWHPTLGVAFAVSAGLGLLATLITARFVRPAAVRFGNIVTFRD